MKTVTILDIPFNAMPEAELLETLLSWLDGGINRVVVTPNPEAVMQSRRVPEFKAALLSAALRLPDGIGVIIASRLIKQPIPNRLRGVDTAYALLKAAGERQGGAAAYFLGASPGVAREAKEKMELACPGLRVTGFHDGYFNDGEETLIIDEINALSPDILLICTGMPRQEIWAHKHGRSLNARVTLCAGGTLDIMSGRLKLTPKWLRRIGLEWLHRLLREPKRAARMLDLPRFIMAVLREKRV